MRLSNSLDKCKPISDCWVCTTQFLLAAEITIFCCSLAKHTWNNFSCLFYKVTTHLSTYSGLSSDPILHDLHLFLVFDFFARLNTEYGAYNQSFSCFPQSWALGLEVILNYEEKCRRALTEGEVYLKNQLLLCLEVQPAYSTGLPRTWIAFIYINGVEIIPR